MTRTNRWMIPLLLIAFALRLHLLGGAPVWWDEGWTVWLIRHPLGAVPSLASRDVHPPLYFLLLWPWQHLAGETTFALRFVSVAGGVLIVALVFRLGTGWLGPRAGLLAATLAALSRFAIWWSQEMRMYTLATVLGLLTLLAAVRFYRHGRRRDGALYVLLAAANLHTFYLSALYPLVANLWVAAIIWRRSDRRALAIRWVAAQLATIALFVPWLIVTLHGRSTWSVAEPFDATTFLRLFWTLFTVGDPTSLDRWAVAAGLSLILFLLALVMAWPKRRRHGQIATLLALGILVPPALVYLFSTAPALRFLYAPQVQARYLVLFLPAFHLLFAWGLVAWFDRQATRVNAALWVAIGLIALTVLLPLPALADYYAGRWPEDRYRSVAQTLNAFRLPDEPVVLHTDRDWPVFDYDAALPAASWTGVPYGATVPAHDAARLLEPLWAESRAVWLVTNRDALRVDPQGQIAGWLADHAAWQQQFSYGRVTLALYARDPDRPRPPLLPPGQGDPQVEIHNPPAGDDGWTLLGYDLPLRRARAGDTIHLALYWRAAGPVTQPVRLVLRDSQGAETTLDATIPTALPANARLRTGHPLRIPPTLRPGRYTLRLAWPRASVALATLSIGGRSPVGGASPAPPAHPLRIRFGDVLRLTGYDLPATTFRPGDTIPLTLHWQATETASGEYKVFVHLLGEVYNAEQQNFLWGQQDVEPLRGELPLVAWPPDRVIADAYRVPVQPQAPPGSYQIEVGLYEPLTGERLPLYDEDGNPMGDRLLLAKVQIVAGMESE